MSLNFSNFARTGLSAAVQPSDTTITVLSVAGFPAANFIIFIDTECLLVTNASGLNWTVTRGQEQDKNASAPAYHAPGAAVLHDLSAGTILSDQFRGSQGPQGASGTGSQGSQGFQGGNGSQGAAGAQGAVGSQGGIGSQGPQGNQGSSSSGVPYNSGTDTATTSNIVSASGHNLSLKGADNLSTNGSGHDVVLQGGTGQGGGTGGSIQLNVGDNGSGGNLGQIYLNATTNVGVLIASEISCPDLIAPHGVTNSVQTNNGTGGLGGDSSFTYDGTTVTAPAFSGDGSALTGVPAAPGGSNTQVNYNSSGVSAGSANLTFDGITLTTWNVICSSNTGSAPPSAGGTSVGDRLLLYNDGISSNQCGIGIDGNGSPWIYHYGANEQINLYCGISSGSGATVYTFDASGFSTAGTISASNFSGTSSGTNSGDQDLSGYALTSSLSSYVLTTDLTTTLTSYATITSLNAVAFSGAASDISGLSVVAISGAYGDLTGRPTGYSGALNDSTSVKIADVVNGLITTVYF